MPSNNRLITYSNPPQAYRNKSDRLFYTIQEHNKLNWNLHKQRQGLQKVAVQQRWLKIYFSCRAFLVLSERNQKNQKTLLAGRNCRHKRKKDSL